MCTVVHTTLEIVKNNNSTTNLKKNPDFFSHKEVNNSKSIAGLSQFKPLTSHVELGNM